MAKGWEPRYARYAAIGAAALLTVAFAAAPGAIAATVEVTVVNAAPAVLSVSLPDSVVPTAGSTKSVSTTIVVEDLNGCSDLSSVDVTVQEPGGSVHIAAAAATFDSCSAGTSATYSYTFDMQYYDAPALSTSHYKVKVVATDSQGATGDNIGDLALFNYDELAALTLNQSTLDFGASLDPDTTSGTVDLGVENYGNVQIDIQLNGSDLDHATESASIAVGNVAYSHASDMSDPGTLTTSAVTNSTFDLGFGSGTTKSLYWQLTVPSGSDQWIPSGTYSGTVTVSAVKG